MLKSLARGAATLAVLAVAGLQPAAAQSVTVYSAGPGGLINALAKGFTAESGIAVDVFQATTGKVMARIEAEASNPAVDVLVSASWGTVAEYDAKGLLLPYSSPNAKMVPDFLKSGTAVAQGISALAIAYNPKSGVPVPKDWADLTGPAYKNLITMPDPASSGSAFELVAALHAKDGNWSLFEGLAKNGMIVPGPNAAALNPVLQGAKAVVFGAVDYISFSRAAKGESIEVVFPASGTVIAPRPIMIFKWSKRQDEAKKLVDYMLSEKGQAEVAKVFLMPARTDIKAKRPGISELKLLPVDSDAAYAKREEILKQFSTAAGK